MEPGFLTDSLLHHPLYHLIHYIINHSVTWLTHYGITYAESTDLNPDYTLNPINPILNCALI